MAAQAYYLTDFYYAKEAVTAGEGPGAAPAKWQGLPIPMDLKPLVEGYALANLLEGEKRFEEANQIRAATYSRRMEAVNECARREGQVSQLKVKVSSR